MAGASAEGEINHWPAFVDVLTTVIMVVTFLLVIMSAAVMVLSQKAMERFKEKLVAEQRAGELVVENGKLSGGMAGAKGQQQNPVKSPQDAEDGTTVSQLGSILKSEAIDGDDRLTIRTRETPDTLKLKVKALEDAPRSEGVAVTAADTLLRVDFEPTAVRYSEDNSRQVVDFLKSRAQPGTKYEIWSFAPETASISEAQRLAFYRAAMTRNVLIRAGIPGSDINTQVRVTDPTSKDGHHVRAVLKP